MNVHQVLSGAGPVDAVTTQARRWRERFTAWGWGGRDVAVNIDPRIGDAIAPLRSLHPADDDVLLMHYSAYAPKLRRMIDLPCRTLLLSHNVTPARWFWDYEPTIAIDCSLGRRELPELAERADVVAGVSAFNAHEIGAETVIPILFDAARIGAPGPRPDGPPTLLFVGRLAPHKRQDELIRVVALLRRHRLPDARLRLVGEPLNARYRTRLERLAEHLCPGAVTFESSIDAEALADRYREADVFVSMSEHEGFCIPLLEAFHLGVPVVARPCGAVPEVAGDAALLAPDRDNAVTAELIALAVEDAELRSTLVERGRARLPHYAPAAAEAAMRAALEPLLVR